MTFVTNKLL